MATITVYGIPNCDTIKKTIDWCKKNKLQIIFHDYKKEGISKEKLIAWCKVTGWEILLNKKSTTWGSLSAAGQNNISNQSSAIQLMKQQTSIIKRPVIEFNEKLFVGFDEKKLQKFFT